MLIHSESSFTSDDKNNKKEDRRSHLDAASTGYIQDEHVADEATGNKLWSFMRVWNWE